MADKKTRVVIEAEAKGFEKAHREVSKTMGALDTDKAERGFKNLTKFTGELGSQFKNLQRTMRDVNKSLQLREGGESMRKMKSEVASLNAEVEKLRQTRKKQDDDDKKRANRRGFAMGMAQGMGVGEYFPEKGLRANIAGRGIGQTIGGLGRAGVGGAFTGAQGLTSGLAGIPLVGGFLAGQLHSCPL